MLFDPERGGSSRSRTSTVTRILLCSAILLVGILLGYHVREPRTTVDTLARVISNKANAELGAPTSRFSKPHGFKIIAMVFYGRRQFVDILDCYLKQNLVENGGYLDEVRFFANTPDETDLAWLDRLVETSPAYNKVVISGGYIDFWRHSARDKSSMFVKIDDDMTYIHEDAIPRLVHSLIDHPEAYAVAANLVNSAVTNWLHWHTGAVHAYLPERSPPDGSSRSPASIKSQFASWRPSSLPKYSGPTPEPFDFTEAVPFEGHRWLPMAGTPAQNLPKTPNAFAAYDTGGPGWYSWAIAAQQHYSLFENLESGTMDKYWGGGSGDTGNVTWNLWYQRYNINLLAVWGETLSLREFMFDDEVAMSVMVPMELKRPLLVQMSSVASHFSFSTQRDVAKTDLLARYRNYANEMVCARDNQKKPFARADRVFRGGKKDA